MKTYNFKFDQYLAYTLCSIFLVLSPIVLSFFFEYSNPNNSFYIHEIVSKHFLKVSACLLFFIGLINVPFLFLNDLGRKTYLIFLSITLYLAAILDFLHVLLFKSRANSSSYFAIFSSNKNEALEFMLDYSSSQLILGVLFIVSLPLLIYYLFVKITSPQLKKALLIAYLGCYAAIILFTFSVSSLKYINESSILKVFHSYQDFKSEIAQLNSSIKGKSTMHANKKYVPQNETYIIVIGESTSKYHMQIYGYNRPTTPQLEKLKSKLIVFENVKASHVHTIGALKDMFILKDTNDRFTSNTLVDCFNKAGFKTFWLSNQPFLGENQTLVSAIANRANKKTFISPAAESKFDEGLIPELDKILKEKEAKKIIFIHLMGTHLSYQDRYPGTFNYFKTANISVFGDHADVFINQYDNAIRYNDFIISEIVKRTDSVKGIGSMVYFSDHGDEVYDFRDFHGHSETLESTYMNSVPFIVYGNKTFIESKKEVYKESRNNLEINFSMTNLSHTLQDLFDIRSDFFDESLSFFSKRKQSIIPNKIDRDSTSLNSSQAFFNFDSKIWVHRVNSIERLNLVQDKFKGIELDIVFENGKFDVRHPPAKSINLSLDEYFQNIKEMQKHYFWLDLKNLKFSNQQEIITCLNLLNNKYHFKNSIIIETTNPELIPMLNKAGYNTSYYLPDIAHSHYMEIEEKVKVITKNIHLNKPHAISQNVENYKLMSRYFTKENKLIWALNLDWNDPTNHLRINNLLKNDPSIKVCLVNYQTNGWR